ncbi:MAG TPA: PLP-dependent aminotransferase family protein, partial [Polyangiaceae bacterium]|nr:PLP-dependent aminotransferase family protein [Polyangiaceae bacterium]
ELADEGWTETAQARGTFVSRDLPQKMPRAFAPGARSGIAERPGFDLAQGPAVPELGVVPGATESVLALLGGVPDVRLVPVAELARAYRRALSRYGRSLLSYGSAWGHPRLRSELARMLCSTRGLAIEPEHVLVTRGSQMALHLVARALIQPGDVIAVESWGYRPAWEALRLAGAELVPIPVDAQGIDTAQLAELARVRRIRAVYVTPHHQYPTTVSLSAARRIELLALARAERMAVIEDDYDHEFHYVGRPVLPLASADRAGVVIYLGTLSKVLAPGLRIGYVVAPPALIDRLASYRYYLDRQGDQAVEAAVALMFEDDEIQRHIGRARRNYTERRGVFVELLERHLAEQLSFRVPSGGMAIWARIARGIDGEHWGERALARGLVLQPTRRFAFDGRPRPYLRLGFAGLTPSELEAAVERLRQALPRRASR